MLSRKHRWLLATGLAAMASSFVTKALLKKGWNTATGDDPPMNPADPRTSWTEAVTWTLAASAVAALTQLAARRTAAGALGGAPPEMYD